MSSEYDQFIDEHREELKNLAEADLPISPVIKRLLSQKPGPRESNY